MEVKSKFNIGETIFFMDSKNPRKSDVTGITFFVGDKQGIDGTNYSADTCSVEYHIEQTDKSIHEKNAYATKEELKQAVFEELEN